MSGDAVASLGIVAEDPRGLREPVEAIEPLTDHAPALEGRAFVQQGVSQGDIGAALLALGHALGILGEPELIPQVFLGLLRAMEIQPGPLLFGSSSLRWERNI